MNKLPRCPCGKVWAPTKQQAERLRKFVTGYHQHSHPVNYYMCEHGGYHWTRQQIWRDYSERVRPTPVLRPHK